MRLNRIGSGIMSAALICPGVVPFAFAAGADAGADSGGLEEITVTATRRSERLEDVPISVTAFSQEKLDAQGLRSIDDLTRLSPGVAFQRNGMSSSGNYNDEGADIKAPCSARGPRAASCASSLRSRI